MSSYKYGIVILQRHHDDKNEYRIALLDGPVAEHHCIDVFRELFSYQPSLGDSVKVKFAGNTPTIVSKCASSEWIRDVEVIGSKVIIYTLCRFTEASLRRTYRRQHYDLQHYIVENEDTDFQKISISDEEVNKLLESRSTLQKRNEPWIYRVGVCWNPMDFEQNERVNWRHYRDTKITPIFEFYYREATLPFISESLIYGVLDGIAIARSADGVLIWTVQLGCVVLSSAICSSDLPTLGSVHHVLAKRCLADRSFGFPCHYEVIPGTKHFHWESIRIIVDGWNRSVYIEAYCECDFLSERKIYCMLVPHVGKISRGIEHQWRHLDSGNKYHFRINFELENDLMVPIIRDLCLDEDEFVDCRIVHISNDLKSYFAVLQSSSVSEKIKEAIDFISIPFRVLFCAKEIRVEKEELLRQCFRVRIRLSRVSHDVVDALHVSEVFDAPPENSFSTVNGSVWIRTTAIVQEHVSDATNLICPQLSQLITDFNCGSRTLPIGSRIAVQAQFMLTPGNVPMFLVRHHAQSLDKLPEINSQICANLRSVRANFVGEPMTADDSMQSVENKIPVDDSVAHDHHTSLAMDPMDFPTILNESEFDRRNRTIDTRVSEFSDDEENIIITESFLGSVSEYSVSSTSNTVFRAPNRSLGSVYASSESSGTSQGSSADSQLRPSIFRYNSNTGSGMPQRTRRKNVKYGYREMTHALSHQLILKDMIYTFLDNRVMFATHERDAFESWSRRPNAKVTSSKKRSALAFAVERIDYSNEFNSGYCKFEALVRFTIVAGDVLDENSSVVVPIGGDFPKMPKSFQLGDQFRVFHFSFFTDRMCRFAGFAKDLGQLYLGPPYDTDRCDFKTDNLKVMENSRGQEYLRFEVEAMRTTKPFIESDVFELWFAEKLPGFIVVEKKRELLKALEPLDRNLYISDVYSTVVEPLAGGPMEISRLIANTKTLREPYVFWRLVIDSNVPMPRLIFRNPVILPKPERPPLENDTPVPFPNAGYDIMAINRLLARERMDRLRAAGHPDVKWLDGPELAPEMQTRKVDVHTRRDDMFQTLEAILKSLPSLHSSGFFTDINGKDLKEKIEEWKPWDDELHSHDFRMRTNTLENGLILITKSTVVGKTYRSMNKCEEMRPLLCQIADTIVNNLTFIKQTPEVKRMVQYFIKEKLHKIT